MAVVQHSCQRIQANFVVVRKRKVVVMYFQVVELSGGAMTN